nr:MAG TPA: hypothetical protein [Caudoviricetes sp.]
MLNGKVDAIEKVLIEGKTVFTRRDIDTKSHVRCKS